MNIRRISLPKKALLIFGSLLAIFVFSLSFVLPQVLKTKLPEIIVETTGRKAAIADFSLTLIPLSIAIQGLEIKEKNDKPFVASERFFCVIDVLESLSTATVVIKEVLLDKPSIHIAKDKKGNFNFNDLASNNESPKPAGQDDFPLVIKHLLVSAGKLVWEDQTQSKAIKTTLNPLQITIDNLRTKADGQGNFNLAVGIESGGQVDLSGSFTIKPILAKGQLSLKDINLEAILALAKLKSIQGKANLATDFEINYAGNKLALKANQAKLNVSNYAYVSSAQTIKAVELTHETDLTFNYQPTQWLFEAKAAKSTIDHIHLQDKVLGKVAKLAMTATLRVKQENEHLDFIARQGKLEVNGIELAEPDKPLLTLPVVALQGIEFNLNDQKISLASLVAKDADIKAWLTKEGNLNYQELFATDKTQGIEENRAKIATKKPWHINAQSIALNNFSLDFTDHTLPKPLTTNLKPINFTVSNYSNSEDAKLPIQLSVGVNKTGMIAFNGNAAMKPLAVDFNVEAKGIDLDKFQLYYDKFVDLDVIDGTAGINGNLSISEKNADLDLKFKGSTNVVDFLTRDHRVHKDLVKWGKLTLNDITVDLLENRYTASSLVVDKPYARVTIRKDKTINFSDILKANQTQLATPQTSIKISQTIPAKTSVKPSAVKPAIFKLGKIKIIDGFSDFTDLSLILPFAAHIKGLDGGASGISSATNSSIDISLKGNAYDLSPVDISGKVSPFIGDYNVEVNFNGLPMPLVSPYMVQFAGYKVEKGKMTLALKYKLANKQLTASNSLLIDQFELGEKIDNPNAVSIPLKLAVALLKDANGRIKFEVPVTGSLENPKFNIRAIIVDAITNALGKVISSPFTALGSLFGSEEDLSTIQFTAGNATLDKLQDSKLSKIADALRERPGLTLEIKGAAFQEQDWPAISDDALYDQLKIRRAAEINKEGAIKTRPEYIELSKDDYQRLLADLFIEKFPLLAEKSILGVPHLKDANFKGDFYEVAKQKMLEVIKPEQERLKDLAAARAQAIAKYIVQKGGVPNERVYILDTAVDPERNRKEIISFLSLSSN